MGLAPWTRNEVWTYWRADGTPSPTADGCKFAKVTGRERAPKNLIYNPLWMLANTYEQTVDEAPWYHGPDPTVPGFMPPTWPQWQRVLYWNFFRNFAENGNMFTWGVADRNYQVEVMEGVQNPMAVQKNDFTDPATGLPLEGYQKVRLFAFEDGSKDRFWTSNSINPTPQVPGKQVSSGYQPSGLFELKWNTIKWDTWPQVYRDAWTRAHPTGA